MEPSGSFSPGAAASPEREPERGRRASQRRDGRGVWMEMTDGAGRAIPFDCFDLSAVGVYLRSDLLLSPGEDVLLTLRLPPLWRPVCISGTVVRSETGGERHGPGMGVAFVEMGDEARESLRRYVAQRLARRPASE